MHMMQLRQDYSKIKEQNSEVVVIGPEGPGPFEKYWMENKISFVGLPDPTHEVANIYGQQVKLLKLGRMPAMMVIDKQSAIRFIHFGSSMKDIPLNHLVLKVLDEINQGTSG